MSGHLWHCCKCCEGIALSDHVGHGGDIEKDRHDGPCTTCGQTTWQDRYDPARVPSTSEGGGA